MEWMVLPLKRYADFNGRSRRMEYWMFTLFQVILYIVLGVAAVILFGAGETTAGSDVGALFASPVFLVIVFAGLAMLVPSIAVQVRRFHDQDKSGWLVLLGLIPYIGGLIVFVFMLLEGTRGENRYGPDPKSTANLDRVFE